MKEVKNLVIEKKLEHENEHLDAPDSERNKRNSKSKYITQILPNPQSPIPNPQSPIPHYDKNRL